jgi:hypothetical protein
MQTCSVADVAVQVVAVACADRLPTPGREIGIGAGLVITESESETAPGFATAGDEAGIRELVIVGLALATCGATSNASTVGRTNKYLRIYAPMTI